MAQLHALTGSLIDVQPLGAALPGQVTTALLKSAQLELVRVVLPAGKLMREHKAPGEVTVLCLEGLIEFTTPTTTLRLGPGQLIHLVAGEPHALLALADASALVTICLLRPGSAAGAP